VILETAKPNTINEFLLSLHTYVSDDSETLNGIGRYVRQNRPTVPSFHTRQAAYRYAAWLILFADMLPNEEGGHSFVEVEAAIANA
jgi:hypothetical protein